MKPEYLAKISKEEEEKAAKGKKDKKNQIRDVEKEILEDYLKKDKAPASKKKKGGKGNKNDPVDKFDPLNFKPPTTQTATEALNASDLKLQLSKFDFKCSACPFGTNVQEEFKGHFKTEWHRINLQRKVKELDPITEDQMKELQILRQFA